MSIKTVMNMVDWVKINLTDNPSLEGMSEHVGYSAFYCSAKFHEMIGLSFKEYVFQRKMVLAGAELKESKLRIIDIAFRYGFSSNEAFTRAFYKFYGCSPKEFRKGFYRIPSDQQPRIQILPLLSNDK